MKYDHNKQFKYHDIQLLPCLAKEMKVRTNKIKKMRQIIYIMLSWQPRAQTIIFKIAACNMQTPSHGKHH
jgi:hypothetical protein